MYRTSSDSTMVAKYSTMPDPDHTFFAWRDNLYNPKTQTYVPDPAGQALKDWASALVPYLGGQENQTFQNFGVNGSGAKIFLCPSDPTLNDQFPGYQLFNNVGLIPGATAQSAPSGYPGYFGGYYPISYGVNADIAGVTYTSGAGICNPGAYYYIAAGNTVKDGLAGPINCKLNSVKDPARTLLFADCGVRPNPGGNDVGGNMLNYCDALFYTTFFDTGAPLPTGNNTIMLRCDENNTGKINLDTMIVPYQPLM
ncbi:MAG: hypothetical protein ACP5QA_00560 [Phycisphaerae bacterium]